MGTTFTTLNVYCAERSTVMPMLLPSDQLRDQNKPWLTVVPSHDTEDSNLERLEKVAKKLTKGSDAAALLFFYFDDDMFRCTLYQNGKKSVSCESDQSWAKLGKALGERFGDDNVPKAFRLASKCSSMEEQIKLLEETVGTAFYELQEDEPRTVKQSDTTLRVIKARETMLKKRTNRFKLTELMVKDWPKELQYRQKLYDALRPQWREYHLSFFLHETNIKKYLVPGGDGMLAYPNLLDWGADWDARQSKLFLMNGKTGDCRELGPISGDIIRAVWQTKDGGMVILRVQVAPLEQVEDIGPNHRQIYSVICVNNDGTERWHFQPELNRFQNLQHVHSSVQGVITLFASGIDAVVKADAVLLQIDGETGELLRSRIYPYQDNVYRMIHVDALNAFLFCRRTSDELVLLDETLKEMQTFGGFAGSYCFEEDQLCGSTLWEGDIWNQRHVSFFDLQNGTSRKTPLEISAYILSVLEDGRILGVNEKQNVLTVFDSEGIVTARCKVPGALCRVISENGNAYLIEVRGPDTHGFVYDALFDQTTIHVWRLDVSDTN